MSSPEVRFRLRKPVVVYVLAICFIGAPLVNIIISMIGFGISHWYTPSVFSAFVDHIAWFDWTWLALTLVAGLCLLKQRKWSWLLAIAALLVASLFNFHYGMKFSSHLAHGRYFFPVLFMLSDFSVIAILYHFRFPYIDRREAWWGMEPRFRCRFASSVEGVHGTVTNISLTGAFFEGTAPHLKLGGLVTLELASISDLKSEIVRLTDQGVGLQFSATSAQKKQIKLLIEALDPAMGEPILSSMG